MNTALPTTIDAYLDALRAALSGADPALVQDALYDAEEFLRSELAEQSGQSEAQVIAKVASSYGAPDEVASIYRDTEYKVRRAIEPPKATPRRSLAGRFFGVAADPRTYGAIFYLLLSMATGIIYFTFATAGLSLSAGLAILIIGIPFFLLFLGLTRVLSLVEGRIVETMLGTRMPRRPLYSDRSVGWMDRIKEMLGDVRTWSTIRYLFIMLPLGIVYFTLTVTGFSLAFGFIAAPTLTCWSKSPAKRPSATKCAASWAAWPMRRAAPETAACPAGSPARCRVCATRRAASTRPRLTATSAPSTKPTARPSCCWRTRAPPLHFTTAPRRTSPPMSTRRCAVRSTPGG